jgi:hypothetical protein
MCKFFSFVTDPENYGGTRFYFDWDYRKKHLKDDGVDSHDHITDFYKLNPEKVNGYEYNPLIKHFTVDNIRSDINDSVQAEKWVSELDFKKIIEPLIIKPIINPFELSKVKKVTDERIVLLKQWASVRASVRASVWASVRDPVWDLVRYPVWDSVRDSVGASVWDSVRDPVWDPIRASVWYMVRYPVWASVRASVVDLVWAYTSSFFNIKYEYDFISATKLWESGIVPSFDGTTWRLHNGKKAKVIYEITAEELRKL